MPNLRMRPLPGQPAKPRVKNHQKPVRQLKRRQAQGGRLPAEGRRGPSRGLSGNFTDAAERRRAALA